MFTSTEAATMPPVLRVGGNRSNELLDSMMPMTIIVQNLTAYQSHTASLRAMGEAR